MDDNLLIFDSNHTSIQMILDDFNNLHPKLQFTAEAEIDHTLNYLDISIHITQTNYKTAIYRKPRSQTPSSPTPSVTPHTTNMQQSGSYSIELNSYNLQEEEYRHELNIIHNILYNNAFLMKPQNPPHITQ